MIIDLLILGIIGCAIEAVLLYAFNLMINANLIASAASLLVVLVAISRWGWKGLLLIPFLAASTVISGRYFNVHEYYREYYDWQFYISICCSLLASGGASILWYKYSDTKLTFKSPYKTFALCSINIFVSLIVLSLIYFILSWRFLFLAFIIWNAFGYALLIIGTFILSRQKIMMDIKQSILERKEELESEREFEFRFDDDEEEIKQEFLEKEGD